jgi:hypothetical protein
MILASLIARIKDRLDKRIRYRRLVAEIESLTPRDLADMRADRGEMLAHAYRQIYG